MEENLDEFVQTFIIRVQIKSITKTDVSNQLTSNFQSIYRKYIDLVY